MSGRIRSVKPEWLEDELLLECSDAARVLSIALILEADDYGNGRAGITGLAGRVFPGKPRETLANALEELRKIRYVLLYELDGQRYFSVRTWDKHQRVDKPGKPKVPGPPQGIAEKTIPLDNVRETPAKVLETPDPDLEGEGKGEEGNRREGDPPAGPAPATRAQRGAKRVPSDWQPKPEHRAIAVQRGADFDLELQKLRDHEFRRPRTDWDATFRNWLRDSRPANGSVSRLRTVAPLSPAMEKLRREAMGDQ